MLDDCSLGQAARLVECELVLSAEGCCYAVYVPSNA